MKEILKTHAQAGLLMSVLMAVMGSGGCGSSAGPVDKECALPDPGVLDFLDNMEDGDRQILTRGGRQSEWYTFHDETAGTLIPAAMSMFAMEDIPNPRCGASRRAMRVTGSGFSDWGSGFGFSFKSAMVNGEWVNLPYDATAARGITFWARRGETSVDTIRLGIGDQYSDPHGGHCDVSMLSGPTACYDHFGTSILLTTDWQRFSFAFGELGQRSFGIPRPTLDVATITNVEFGLPSAAPVFDVWIDDVAFFD